MYTKPSIKAYVFYAGNCDEGKLCGLRGTWDKLQLTIRPRVMVSATKLLESCSAMRGKHESSYAGTN